MIDKEMGNNVDAVEYGIQNAIWTAIENNNAPRITLAIRLINASSGLNATGATAN